MKAIILSSFFVCATLHAWSQPVAVNNPVVSGINTNKARIGYIVRGSRLVEFGVCYSTFPGPTLQGGKSVTSHRGNGVDIPMGISYKVSIGDLIPATEYFARAYAKNSTGDVIYSNEVKFITEKEIDFSGMLNGPKKEFYPNGALMKEYTLKDGQIEGSYRFYDDSSRLLLDQYIKNGLPNGPSKTYFPSGQLKSETSLKDGIQNGMSKEYRENGALKSTSNLTGDPPKFSGETKQFYDNGQLKTESYVSNGEFMSATNYDREGRITSIQKPGNNVSYSYDNDGWQHKYVNGERCQCSRCIN
jgi:antitoxin component YwqK of YwqJK toxin-antitoxin module